MFLLANFSRISQKSDTNKKSIENVHVILKELEAKSISAEDDISKLSCDFEMASTNLAMAKMNIKNNSDKIKDLKGAIASHHPDGGPAIDMSLIVTKEDHEILAAKVA